MPKAPAREEVEFEVRGKPKKRFEIRWYHLLFGAIVAATVFALLKRSS